MGYSYWSILAQCTTIDNKALPLFQTKYEKKNGSHGKPHICTTSSIIVLKSTLDVSERSRHQNLFIDPSPISEMPLLCWIDDSLVREVK